ncbi:MAG: hypothetical protein ACLP01_11670 [Solirubrobacteraceae bacterium]
MALILGAIVSALGINGGSGAGGAPAVPATPAGRLTASIQSLLSDPYKGTPTVDATACSAPGYEGTEYCNVVFTYPSGGGTWMTEVSVDGGAADGEIDGVDGSDDSYNRIECSGPDDPICSVQPPPDPPVAPKA